MKYRFPLYTLGVGIFLVVFANGIFDSKVPFEKSPNNQKISLQSSLNKQIIVAETPKNIHIARHHGDYPKPIIETNGAIGTPARYKLSDTNLTSQKITKFQDAQDWTTPWVEDFDESAVIDSNRWNVLDQNGPLGGDVYWGVDDNPYFTYNASIHSVWVAAGGTDKRDSEIENYPPTLDTWLLTKNPLDLRGMQMANVEFYMYYDIEPRDDWIFVGVSADGKNFVGEYWTGQSGEFQYFNLDLSEFIGYSQVYLGWYFHSDEDMENGEGVWIDHIVFWIYQDTGPAQSTQLVKNGGFETGDFSSWTSSPSVEVVKIANPNQGEYAVRLGGGNSLEQKLYQPFTLPSDTETSYASRAQVEFWVNIFGVEDHRGADQLCAGIYTKDLNTLLIDLGCLDGIEALAFDFDSNYWWHANYRLTEEDWVSLNGQQVSLLFQMTTNGDKPTTVLLDDIRFEIETSTPKGDEPNDTFANATTISLGNPRTGMTIDPDDDVDIYRFQAFVGDLAIVDIDSAVFGSPLDSYVQIYDSTGNSILCENDDDGVTRDSFVVCEIQRDDTYYIRVSSYDGQGDRNYVYNLFVELKDSEAPTPTLPAPSPPITNPLPPIRQSKPWTVILYLSGDNNLCGLYSEMINSLGIRLADKLNDFLNVLVLLDRHPVYCDGQGNATRFVIQPDNTYVDHINRWDMGEVNMGDPQTLVSFVQWVERNFPAEHYYLAIANHGGGISGVSFDETNQGDRLMADEVYSALKRITNDGEQRFDLISLDASLTGLFENAYDLRKYANYLLLFPTISPFSAYSYPEYISHPNFTSNSLGVDLANIILDVVSATVSQPYGMVLIQTDEMDEVKIALDSLAETLLNQIDSTREKIAIARSTSQKVDANGDNRLSEKDYYIDLWDFASQLISLGLVQDEAGRLKGAIEDAVLRYVSSTSITMEYNKLHGLTVYFPWTPTIGYSAYVRHPVYSSSKNGVWDEFLKMYFMNFQRGMPINPGITHSSIIKYQYLPIVAKMK